MAVFAGGVSGGGLGFVVQVREDGSGPWDAREGGFEPACAVWYWALEGQGGEDRRYVLEAVWGHYWECGCVVACETVEGYVMSLVIPHPILHPISSVMDLFLSSRSGRQDNSH